MDEATGDGRNRRRDMQLAAARHRDNAAVGEGHESRQTFLLRDGLRRANKREQDGDGKQTQQRGANRCEFLYHGLRHITANFV